MAVAVMCSLCQPGLLGGEPTHHPGTEQGHTMPGLLGGWKCACLCTIEDRASRETIRSVARPRAGPGNEAVMANGTPNQQHEMRHDMDELDVAKAATMTREEILRYGIAAIAHTAPGGHADPDNPCYGEKRKYKDFAVRILGLAERPASAPSGVLVQAAQEAHDKIVTELQDNAADLDDTVYGDLLRSASDTLLLAAKAAESG